MPWNGEEGRKGKFALRGENAIISHGCAADALRTKKPTWYTYDACASIELLVARFCFFFCFFF